MELRQLRYFVEIADRASFTRASEALSIAQPALSTQIRKLETEFGAPLLVRSNRGITLTDVGRVVLEQARRTLDAADATQRSAALAAETANARLVLGYTRIFPFIQIARIIRGFRRERPEVQIELREMWSHDQMDALLSGALDIGFVQLTEGDEDRDLAIVPMSEESLMLAVPSSHRFASRRQISLPELADEAFVLPSVSDFGESVRDLVFAAAAQAGFTPRIVQETSDVRILLALVSAGLGVTVLASGSRDVRVRGVHYVTIVPAHIVRYAIMHRRGYASRALQTFLHRMLPS